MCQLQYFREEFDRKGEGGGDGIRHFGSLVEKAEPEIEEDSREVSRKQAKKIPPPAL